MTDSHSYQKRFSRRPGPLRKQTPASSSATPTGRRWPTSISRRSRGGAQRLTYEEARRIAANIGKLPARGLLQKPRADASGCADETTHA